MWPTRPNFEWWLFINTTHYVSIAEFECDYNYRLIGSIRRICTENVKWSSSSPVCDLFGCKPIVHDNITNVFGFDYSVNAKGELQLWIRLSIGWWISKRLSSEWTMEFTSSYLWSTPPVLVEIKLIVRSNQRFLSDHHFQKSSSFKKRKLDSSILSKVKHVYHNALNRLRFCSYLKVGLFLDWNWVIIFFNLLSLSVIAFLKSYNNWIQ